MYANPSTAARAYQSLGAEAAVGYATPHQLIQMLFAGAMDRIAAAKGQMERKDYAAKGALLSKALALVGELRACLNREQGGEIAANLDALYDYLQRLLAEASASNETARLDEAIRLLGQIKSGWDAIAPR
jgi:flagellar protein FliS